MTTVSSTSSSTSTSSTSTTSDDDTTIDYDTFLQLLITEMENQDPTDPMDTTEYMSQLAAFSEVEQSVATNSKLDEIYTSLALDNADALIGKTIETSDGTTGTISSVIVSSDGITAVLTDGSEVEIDDGTEIS